MRDEEPAPVILTGRDLTALVVEEIAAGRPVALAPEGVARMAESRRIVDRAVDEGRRVYGLTTGLGAKATEALSAEELSSFAYATIRGRAHAVGADLPAETCRAALAIRLNTMMSGASGAQPALALLMERCLAAGVAPAIRAVGSIGAADLMQGGDFGLALIGEGRMHDAGAGAEADAPGGIRPAAEALADAGLAPHRPGPKDGLALVSHSSVSAARAALGVAAARAVYHRLQTSAALSMEGFRANLSPLDLDVLAIRPQPGQDDAAAELSGLLAGSALWSPGAARRLQDPLSIRNLPQGHGALLAALRSAETAVEAELNGASDNPGVLLAREEILSNGGYLTPHLAITLGALAQALSQSAAVEVARIAKLLAARFSGLTPGLGDERAGAAGLGPLMKTAEALWAAIAHAAAPPPIHPGFSADGLEDVSVHTGLSAEALTEICGHMDRLASIERIVAAQAIEARALSEAPPPALRPAVEEVRALVPGLGADRPFGDAIETLAKKLRG
ncbi:MAG: aromatic amino acid lyase [Pseudomonadota bacterium]